VHIPAFCPLFYTQNAFTAWALRSPDFLPGGEGARSLSPKFYFHCRLLASIWNPCRCVYVNLFPENFRPF